MPAHRPSHWPRPSSSAYGYPHIIQNDMQLEAQLVMNGVYCGGAGWADRRPDLSAKREEWALLLQLDSDEDAGFMWGDGGMVYCWARSADMVRQDFSKTWMALQCY